MNQRSPARGRQYQLFNPSEIHPNPKHVIQQNVGSDEIPRQKLSCSQLIHFLKTSSKSKLASELPSSAAEVKYRPNLTEASFSLIQNISTTASVDQRVTALTGAKKDVENKIFSKSKVSEPVFAEKESSAEVSYHWMIATSTELWDIGDIFSDAHQSLPEPFPNEVPDFNFQADCKVPDLSSRSVCPSAEESWRLKDGQSPDTLTDHTEDDHAVHVTIPEFQSHRFEEIPVVISHVVHPNKFFIQHKDTDLCELSEIMQRNSSRSLAEMNRIPDIGAYVMVWFLKQEMWCRGQIIRIRRSRGPSSRDCKDTKVEVRRVDYGDVVWVSLWDLKELCGETASIPVQALQVSLANVRPVNGETWSFEAINWFKSKVQNKTLYARLYQEEGEVLVELFMEKGKIGAMRRGDSLSVRLALNRFAIHECNKPRSLKRSDVPEQTRQQSLQWEKYLISCYSHNRK
ncbi:uncharacterized protein LOC109093846 [Cyprinus carpio]|uniref:Uncharacterized protein LOC109093846 n=1 Tax=Cyprinus carpio TaxID=7962 RepID=A0A9Q9YSQ4_CYPCA|nr:uncharacterized protein LOC109093846 [Cyprinus carpio]XP_042625695.1 uncharacterized protein LOC109093846 [Cyprinus carpio]XP_042625696.1 uncharacterized protein LOC109093846 [Cyprinus carpio]XP_042625697.1 uncharacterized protein LOC109093846 [Cyprinus carpio]XP_042625698.1 uncharacterized protein LOC109093846 [Cyprinus carpio]XP_042625699.1 uncharacterized protein LOC109093846 [Cyprinus carpio]XP_042625700.1 uncharacterized protein LOC109093846 [Cyprinus carpio]XP_042625701.1 uncharacte